MSTAAIPAPVVAQRELDQSVEIVIPVYNEESDLVASVARLRQYLDACFPFPALITIVDNASTDRTWIRASHLAETMPGVTARHLERKGRGYALREAWSQSQASIVAYMDVDLSTDLGALLPLVAPLVSGHSDLAIGTRLARGAHVVRGPKREVISRCYNFMVRAALRNEFSDAQCGFKALRTDVARHLLPMVEDDQWFFDTELLVQAERAGLRIHEVPVDWVDDADSRVDIVRTALDDLKGIWRLTWQRGDGQLPRPVHVQDQADSLRRFASVGVVSTLVYLVLYLLLRASFGEYGANATALALCTVGNTVAHRRITFGNHAGIGWRVATFGTLAVFLTSLILTSGALALVNAVVTPSALTEALALTAGSIAAAMCRFVLLRSWMFRTRGRSSAQPLRMLGGDR